MSNASLDTIFPPSPKSVPAALTAPSSAYKMHARLAMAGLFTFIVLYLSLTGYLGWTVYRLLGRAILTGHGLGSAIFASIVPLFFFLFLARGFFIVKSAKDPSLVEATPQEEPLLFQFLHRLADETRAPRPHRVYLSARVNAAVFYDLSFWNLLFPTRKNLELGLGLVNVLTLDEIKAVIAHEYGHFAQRTMAVGRWVYIARQIAGHIVGAHSVFDRLLHWLSSIDLRVAWIGWILRIIVWAIRAVLDSAFRLVLLAERALGREMEFQADRVAVSVSGSDSLIHALHRLGPADQASEEAISFAISELRAGHPVNDLLAIQTQAMGHISRILDKPEFGKSPARPETAGVAAFRVFTAELAEPPKMWSTHPSNHDREASAKQMYVPSTLDARDAWVLFQNPQRIRTTVSQAFFKLFEIPPPEKKPEVQEGDTQELRLAKRYRRPALDPSYRGLYLGRDIAAHHAAPRLKRSANPSTPEALAQRLRALYPASLRDDLTKYRELRKTHALLEGLAAGFLTAPGGVIRHRGQEIRKRQLPLIVASAKKELDEAQAVIVGHDQNCRQTHYDAAHAIGHGWPEHLAGLYSLLHFATHMERELIDASTYLHHQLEMAVADGRVSGRERKQLVAAGQDVFEALQELWAAKKAVYLPHDVAQKFEWDGLNEPLGLLQPTDANLGDWFKVQEGWVRAALYDLGELNTKTLDALLQAEQQVASWVLHGGEVSDAPTPAAVPGKYRVRLLGEERKRNPKMHWWDRFQTADGIIPGVLRFVIALVIVVPVLMIGGNVGSKDVHIVNGLDTPVKVKVNNKSTTVAARSKTIVRDLDGTTVHVEARTPNGTLIETFDESDPGAFSQSVYNVAKARVMYEWTAVYGTKVEVPPRVLGNSRWTVASQDVVLDQPPTSVSLKRGQTARKTVLDVLALSPLAEMAAIKSPEAVKEMITAHVRFDDLKSKDIDDWLIEAAGDESLKPLLLERAKENPSSISLERAITHMLPPAQREARCEQARIASNAKPADADLLYLALRCGEANNEDIQRAYQAHPTHAWLANLAAPVLATTGRWNDAQEAWKVALTGRSNQLLMRAAMEGERTRRAAEAAGKTLPKLQLNKTTAEQMEHFLAAEAKPTADDRPQLKVLRALHAGRLSEVAMLVPPNDPLSAFMTIAVAASDGATPEMVSRALELEDADLPSTSASQLAALMIRSGKEPNPVFAHTDWSGLQLVAVTEVLTGLADGSVAPKKLDSLAATMTLDHRGMLYSMGAIVMGAKAPGAWRRNAKTMLFMQERPYFK